MTSELGELLVAYLDGPEASCAQDALGTHMERHPEDVPEILEFIRDAAGLQLILEPSLDSLPERVRDTLEFGKSGNAFCDRVIHEVGRSKHEMDGEAGTASAVPDSGTGGVIGGRRWRRHHGLADTWNAAASGCRCSW